MNNEDINKQSPTSEDGKQPAGQDQGQEQSQSENSPEAHSDQPSETGQAEGGKSEGGSGATGQAEDSDTLTEETTGEQDGEIKPTGQTTDENKGGFVGSKGADESGYLQEERKSESDIEGAALNKDDQNS
ncbi:MAG: hypothetical protein ABIS23_00095 [Sphingomicrobium sp.]